MNQIDRLLGIMQRLRDPENGCPWDKEQTFATIAPYTLEETYEVLDAIAREDFDDLRGELGDLLFQVVFYAQMAQEEGRFNFDDICAAISDKLERRHPHVFADVSASNSTEVGKERLRQTAIGAPRRGSALRVFSGQQVKDRWNRVVAQCVPFGRGVFQVQIIVGG